MRKGITFLIVCIFTIFLSCTQDEVFQDDDTIQGKESASKKFLSTSTIKSTLTNPLAPEIVRNQVVVEYVDKGIDQKGKDHIKKVLKDRYSFEIKDIKKCNCDNSSIELWTVYFFNPGGAIEDLIGPHDVDEDGLADLNGDYQFSFFVKEKNQSILNGYINQIDEMVHLNSSNDRINIAIIDTGIDYDYFETPFLYNNSNDDSNCLGNEISGWDFVNKDNDPRDDHGHGTFVSAIIRDVLTQENVPYQILPVKAFDSSGRGTYFDILCGLQFIASKEKPFLVNCSFGFYNLKNQIIFEKILEENSNNLLLMASAGNDDKDTDLSGDEHFPSGYESDNVLAVGGYDRSDMSTAPYLGAIYVSGYNLAERSNYGYKSIDVVASFKYDLTLTKGVKKNRIIYNIPLQGTSFSCPIVTARAAALYHQNVNSPRVLKNEVINTCYKDYSLRDKIKNNNVLIKGSYRAVNPIGPGQLPY